MAKTIDLCALWSQQLLATHRRCFPSNFNRLAPTVYLWSHTHPANVTQSKSNHIQVRLLLFRKPKHKTVPGLCLQTPFKRSVFYETTTVQLYRRWCHAAGFNKARDTIPVKPRFYWQCFLIICPVLLTVTAGLQSFDRSEPFETPKQSRETDATRQKPTNRAGYREKLEKRLAVK